MKQVGPKRKNILITGASSGIGEELAKQFAKLGRNLVLCARREQRLTELAEHLQHSYPTIRVLVFALDVNDEQQVFSVFSQAAEQLGGLDRIIVNAGIGGGKMIGSGHYQHNKRIAETNFIGALTQCEAAMEIFRLQNHGHLVTMSSMSSEAGLGNTMTVYAATKAALKSMAQGIAIDTLSTPINVTSIHPGYIETEITNHNKKLPFMVDVHSGCKQIVKAIEKEVGNAFLPWWPWAIMRYVLLLAPNWLLRRFS
ncbi:SDR family oxidoreductase [Thalassotalea ponticola]|uniref:SDR family oxidoreductase n=1 Tax=Thalassotalea ponticola TaxID=1523392 RepID=UPI0025B2AFE1|nr:SDR family oxidoreductase [Thalassotalea ponticola]MDN3652046.1 SDR family oxidoreductase [Thalassotalea ponticola]